MDASAWATISSKVFPQAAFASAFSTPPKAMFLGTADDFMARFTSRQPDAAQRGIELGVRVAINVAHLAACW